MNRKNHWLRFRAPIHLTRSLREPDVQPGLGAIVVRGGVALLFGTQALPATVVLLIETGPAKDSDCRALISLVGKRSGTNPGAFGRP